MSLAAQHRPGGLSNVSLQRALKDNERELRDFEAVDLETVLSSEAGRRFFYRLVFEVCNIESSAFNPLIKDGVCAGLHMAHMEGRRDVGRVMLQEAQAHCPALWRKMLAEALVRAEAAAAKHEQLLQAAGDSNDD